MKSENDGAVLQFPDLEERFDAALVHDAAHVLDRDLLQPSQEVKDDLIPARIRGLDTPEEVAVYRAVESRMRDRERVFALIDERVQTLLETGYRHERTAQRRDVEPGSAGAIWSDRPDGERSAVFYNSDLALRSLAADGGER